MKPTTRDGILRGGSAALIRLLILAAAGISAYLLSVSLNGGNAVGCGPGSSCDEVLRSNWAYVLGIPVSALALLVDLTLLLTTFSCSAKSTSKQRRAAWEILIPCSLLVLGGALWFIALQAVVLHRFCPWCMTAHACGALAAVLLLMRVPVSEGKAESGKRKAENNPGVRRGVAVKFAVAALLAVAAMGLAQTLVPRKTYSVANVPAATSNSVLVSAPNLQANNSPATLSLTNSPGAPSTSSLKTNIAVTLLVTNATTPIAAGASTLDLFAGKIHLDLTQVPMWGSPAAPLKLVSLYDYTCHHCREMHPRVADLQRMFGDKLAIVSLPMPLDAQCNYLMKRTSRPQTNACVYAKLGLITWRANHKAIQPFDDWLFGFEQTPPLTEVTNKVVQLVGTIPFEAASRDPWIEQQLRTDVELFAVSMRDYHNGSMPQFMIGTNIITGTLTTEQLRAMVAKYADAAPAPPAK